MAENRHEGTDYRAGCPGAADLPGFTDRNYWQRKAAEMSGRDFNAEETEAERQEWAQRAKATIPKPTPRPIVPAFPVPLQSVPNERGMSLSEYYAGRALEFFLEREGWPSEPGAADQIAKRSFAIGDAMEAEAIRRRGGA